MWEFQGIMLTAEELVRRRTKTESVLPTKGPKCFTPSGSWLETKQLQTLLDATKALIAEERVEQESALAQAEWDENVKVARVTRIVGRQFEKFGHEENMTVFLFPEEALYLLETNHLQLLYGGVSMSIQQAYTVLIGPKTGCSFAEYMVFAHLLKNGFKVLRHSAKRTVTRYERQIGLHQEHPRNRKSRRKSNAPEKENSSESSNKNVKTDKKIENKNERNAIPRTNNVDLCIVSTDSKCDKSIKGQKMNVLGESCLEAIVDSNSSSGSDIEILSEKSIFRSEESLDFEVTEYSSSVSEDSDCQVIEINTEVIPSTNERKRNPVIEEINLSDSDESEINNSHVGDPSHIKSEVTSEVVSCTEAEVKEEKTIQDEQSNSNASCSSECYINRKLVHIESSISEMNEHSDGNIVEASNSNDCSFQELLVDHSTEERSLPVISSNVNEKETHKCENEMAENISILSDEIEGKCSSLSLSLSRESVIWRNTTVSFKKECDSIILEPQQKQKEIEVIDLDDENNENGIFEDKNTILLSFPNIAGCRIIRCDVPPQRLCPPNVCPNQQTYSIILDRLQDPRYGGNPRKKKNSHNDRFQNHHVRSDISGHSKGFRFHSHRSRPFNRFSDNINPWNIERRGRWHNNMDQSRDDSFADHSGFPRSRDQPMYPNFLPTHLDQSDQNAYPHFSGQPLHNSPSYRRPRGNSRHRGNPNREMYRQNSPSQNYRFRNSRFRRCPRRRGRGGRGGRTICPDRYVAPRELEHNELLDERDGNYVPFNVDNSHSSYDQTRTQDHGLGEKRHRGSYEENTNSSCSGEKRSRRMRPNYFPPSSRSQNLLQFLDTIHPDATENVIADSVPVVSGSNCDDGQNDFRELGRSINAFTETESTDNTSSHERSSCSGSCSSQDSSEESMDESYENEMEKDAISVLLKSDNLEDIDSCLKSLEIVDTVKFKSLAAVSDEPLLTIKFDLYQPSTPFRRSDPPVPDFRVVVMRPDQNLPTSRQLAFLGESFDDDVPLLFAIASCDSVAFYLQSVVNLPLVSSKEKVHG